MAYQPMASQIPDGWGANYIVHVLYGLDSNYEVKISRLKIVHGGFVTNFVSGLYPPGEYPPDGYAFGDFVHTPDLRFAPLLPKIDIPIRGSSYIIIEFEQGSELFLDHEKPGGPVWTSKPAVHGALRFVDLREEDPIILYECPEECRMFFFGTTGQIDGLTHHQIKIWLRTMTRGPGNSIEPDIPNDGGKPVPPGLLTA